MPEQLSERQSGFLDAFHQLMREYTDVVGPVVVQNEDVPEKYEGSFSAEELSQMAPVKNAGLSEWIILSSWVDLDNGEVYTSAFTLPDMPIHHRLGLLVLWLETWK